MGSGPAAAPEPEGSPGSQASSGQLLLSMNDFANFKQIGKGKDCVVYAASCEKLGGHSVVLKVSGSRPTGAALRCIGAWARGGAGSGSSVPHALQQPTLA